MATFSSLRYSNNNSKTSVQLPRINCLLSSGTAHERTSTSSTSFTQLFSRQFFYSRFFSSRTQCFFLVFMLSAYLLTGSRTLQQCQLIMLQKSSLIETYSSTPFCPFAYTELEPCDSPEVFATLRSLSSYYVIVSERPKKYRSSLEGV